MKDSDIKVYIVQDQEYTPNYLKDSFKEEGLEEKIVLSKGISVVNDLNNNGSKYKVIIDDSDSQFSKIAIKTANKLGIPSIRMHYDIDQNKKGEITRLDLVIGEIVEGNIDEQRSSEDIKKAEENNLAAIKVYKELLKYFKSKLEYNFPENLAVMNYQK